MRDLDYLKLLNTPLEKTTLIELYNHHKISYDRSMVFYDFIISLTILLDKTFLGDDYIKEEDRESHFRWCWDKTIDSFSSEGINLSSNGDLYKYLWEHYAIVFYSIIDKENVVLGITNLWDYVFNIKHKKTLTDFESFKSIYDLFEKTLE